MRPGLSSMVKWRYNSPPLLRLQDPLPVKPVLRALGIAVEPQPAAGHVAPGAGLLHEAPGHQRRLVQQHARQGTALDQRRAGLVPSAEDEEAVLPPPGTHDQEVLRPHFPHRHPQPSEIRHQLLQKVSPQRGDGLAAQAELPPVKAALGPQEKGQSHGKGLAAADGTVTDDGLPPLPAPPGQHLFLFGGEAHDLSRAHRPPSLGGGRQRPGRGPRPRAGPLAAAAV